MAEARFTRILDDLVGLHYRAAALGDGRTSDAVEALHRYASKYTELETLVRDAYRDIPSEIDVPKERCIITHHKRTFLRQAVGALDKEKSS